jgi:hypothetical protein
MAPRDRFALTLLTAAAVAVAVSACAEGTPDATDDAACKVLLDDPESLDAFDWLKAPSPLPKRPGTMSTDEALALAHRLEMAGAVRVVVVGVRKERSPVPRESSTGVVVTLPPDDEKRLAVFRLYAVSTRNDGKGPRADTGQKYLFVPWTRAAQSP